MYFKTRGAPVRTAITPGEHRSDHEHGGKSPVAVAGYPRRAKDRENSNATGVGQFKFTV